jgi:hypothetical protein
VPLCLHGLVERTNQQLISSRLAYLGAGEQSAALSPILWSSQRYFLARSNVSTAFFVQQITEFIANFLTNTVA